MSISSMIREEVKNLAYSGEDIKVRELSRKYNCSPSLVVKNIYKVEEKENLKHLTKFGVKGKVNLLIIDFENDYKEDEHLNERKNEDKNSKLDKVDRKISNSNKTLSKNNDSPQNKNISSDRIYKFSQDKLSDFEEINNFSPTENSHTKNNPSLQLFASQNSDQPKRNSNNKNIFFENSQPFNSHEKIVYPLKILIQLIIHLNIHNQFSLSKKIVHQTITLYQQITPLIVHHLLTFRIIIHLKTILSMTTTPQNVHHPLPNQIIIVHLKITLSHPIILQNVHSLMFTHLKKKKKSFLIIF